MISDEQARRLIRAAQIDAVVQLVPLTMTINILNTAIIVGVFWDTGANVVLSIWGALILLEAGASLWSWTLTRHKPPTGASARAIRRTVLHAAFLGGTWGAAPGNSMSGAAPQVPPRKAACKTVRRIARAEAPVGGLCRVRVHDQRLAPASNKINAPQIDRITFAPVSQKTPTMMAVFKILIVMVSGTS